MLRSLSLWLDDVSFEEKLVSKHPWEATSKKLEINSVSLKIVLLVELESM